MPGGLRFAVQQGHPMECLTLVGRRQFVVLLSSAATAWPIGAHAQQPDRVRRIGVLMATADDREGRLAAFREALSGLGWREGRNIKFDVRWGAGNAERTRAFAAELAGSSPDLLLAHASLSLKAFKEETHSIPIVFVVVTDPVGTGFVQSLARPGGNMTGLMNFEASMMGKWLQLLKEVSPSIARVALLFNPDTAPAGGDYFLRFFESAAPQFDVKTIVVPVRDSADLDGAIAAVAREPDCGLVVMSDVFTMTNHEAIGSLAARHQVPAVYPFRYFATAGGLISYGIDVLDLFKKAALYADQILKGAKPADLPVQAPTKFELVINLKAAKALGLTLPASLLARADEVIE